VAIKADALKANLKKDNPTYERVLKSDLHDVVSVASKPGVTAKALATAMRKVKKDKWAKYPSTWKYLLKEVPGLEDLVVGKLINFHTKSIVAGPSAMIVHTLAWASSTGDLKDLSHAQTREHVWWDAPNALTKPLLLPEYAKAGEHFGQGNAVTAPAEKGSNTDEHQGIGPFLQKIFDKSLLPEDAVAESILKQAYQVSYDKGPWQDIPGSKFVLRRRVLYVNGKLRLEQAKKGVDNATKMRSTHDF
jgi:hypothetical protein